MATICSGNGAPEVASIGLGFTHEFMAEIEPFPSAILAHHWPHVPNLGDMTKIDGEAWCGQVDVLVGGTPCQAFSVAGKRESLNDERGNLTLKFVELCDAINPAYVVWENVPGVLSTADNAFGCFLGALSGNDGELFPAGDGWSNAGCVIGPRRKLAWRILDAQYFGLAQRRRRVFVVACPRDGADPCEILFEREGVQRHSAPSREKGEGTTHDVAPCIGASGRGFERGGDTRGQDPVVAVSPTLRAGGNRTGGDRPPGTDVDTADSLIIQGGGPENGQIAGTVSRKWAKGSGGPAGDECYNMVAFAECGHFCGMSETQAADPLLAKGGYCGNGSEAVCVTGPVTHALKAEGCDGSEDGTGRGQPIIAFPANLSTTQHASAEDISPAMGAKNPTGVAFEPRCARNGRGMPEEIVPPLKAQSGMTGKGDSAPCVATALSVRRLTPVECERLMGLPDNYTRIPSWSGWKKLDDGEDPAQLTAEGLEVKQNKKTGKWRVKDVDGPRYKALGNSMAVPVMRWILKNIRSQS